MAPTQFNQILESVGELSSEQRQQLRRALDGDLADAADQPAAVPNSGSIGAMREDADFLDEVIAGAMKARREQPWRLPPGE
jgi:hypothetical protein